MNHLRNILSGMATGRARPGTTLFYLFAFCILAISLTFFVSSIGKPYTGMILSKDNQGWVVVNVDINGAASNVGIREGDRPIEINDQPAQIFLDDYEKVAWVFGRLINQITVSNEEGQLTSLSLEDSLPSSESVIELIAWFIVSFIFWITGFYVFFKRPQNKAAVLLCLGGLTFGLALSANMAVERVFTAAIWPEIMAATIGSTLLLHFFIILPEERAWLRSKRTIYLIYLPAVITLVLFPIIGYANGQPLPLFRTIRLLEHGTLFLAAASVAIFNYYRAISPRTKQQMKIVLIGCLAALIPFLILNIIPEAIWKNPVLPTGYSILLIAFIPLSMGHAVVTQKLLDIDIIIRRGVVYGLITCIMAAILSIAIFAATYIHNSLGLAGEILIALFLGGIAVALFGPTQRAIEALIDKFFYKDRYDYRQIIQSVNISLSSLKEFNEISRFIVGTVVRTLNLAGGCLVVKGQTGYYEINAALGTFAEPDKTMQILNSVTKRNTLVEFPNSAAPIDPDIMFIIPLSAGEKEVGILCLSNKASRQEYTADDIFLLQGLVSVAAVALHSAMLIRDVSIRDTFVSIASHELRTPLTSVMGYTELLLKRNAPEDIRRKWIENIYKNGQVITDIVDDLLNVSRIQSGKVSMKLKTVQLSDILKDKLEMAREMYDDNHEFVSDIEPDLPDALVDYDKFGQIIGNLLSNAVKYSPGGGRVTLAAHRDKGENRIVVSVTDEGIGISPSDRDLLFTTFHRIQRPETQSVRGCGLGLYIVKEWTRAMNGDVWLESELNKGSTFYVAVPIHDQRLEKGNTRLSGSR